MVSLPPHSSTELAHFTSQLTLLYSTLQLHSYSTYHLHHFTLANSSKNVRLYTSVEDSVLDRSRYGQVQVAQDFHQG